MAKRYLVTGGTGFIGAGFVKRLVEKGERVRVLDNLSRSSLKGLSSVKNDIEFVKGDIRDTPRIFKALKGVDTVCHFAYINGTEFFYTKPEEVLEVGVKGMLNVLDGAVKYGIKELLLASSSEVYQMPLKVPTDEKVTVSIPDIFNPRYSYSAGKIISEIMAINYGRKYFKRTIIFRPHNVYGPDMGKEHVIPQFAVRMGKIAKKNKDKEIFFPVQGTGKETRAFVYIDDFLDGLEIVLKKGKNLEVYNIGNAKETKIENLAVEIGRYYGKRVKIVPGKLKAGSTKRRCPDISKLKKLGYRTKIDLKTGLAQTVRWYDEQYIRTKGR